MKKLGDIMNELGFRTDAPQSAKEAFIKHLVKQAYGVDLVTPSEKPHEPQQLSFEIEGSMSSPPNLCEDGKKVS